jgi:hypothetical protein
MTSESGTSAPELVKADRRLVILLAMAMFVLVADTSVIGLSGRQPTWVPVEYRAMR